MIVFVVFDVFDKTQRNVQGGPLTHTGLVRFFFGAIPVSKINK